MSTCPQCKKPRRPHYACSNCGFYDGRQAIAQKDAAPAASSSTTAQS
jgi:large subunit ribosomal protein L32